MGYCLIPSTKAQKMLMLVSKGGEGKSRVGIVLSALLGTNMYNGSTAKVETSPFARADLEYGLLLVDDDMKMERNFCVPEPSSTPQARSNRSLYVSIRMRAETGSARDSFAWSSLF